MKIVTHKTKRALLLTLASILLIVTVLLTLSFSLGNNKDDANVAETTSKAESLSNSKFDSSIYSKPENSDVYSDTNEEPTSSDDTKDSFHGWIINNLGYTYIYDGCGYEQFNYKEYALNRYINCLNEIDYIVDDKMQIYNIIVPVSSTFAEIPKDIYVSDNFYSQSQSVFVSTVQSKINSTITNIPIVNILEEKFDNGEYVFFRTDRNWTQLGAYYAYVAFCESTGVEPYPLESFVKKSNYEFLGSFYNATELEELKENCDTICCYGTVSSVGTALTIYDKGKVYNNYRLSDNKVNISNAYDCFLGITAGRYEINTNIGNESLLIIGDSSVHPIIPFLASHYNKIDFIDPKIHNETLLEFIKNRKYNAVLTMCYSTNAVNGDFIPALNEFAGVITNE